MQISLSIIAYQHYLSFCTSSSDKGRADYLSVTELKRKDFDQIVETSDLNSVQLIRIFMTKHSTDYGMAPFVAPGYHNQPMLIVSCFYGVR